MGDRTARDIRTVVVTTRAAIRSAPEQQDEIRLRGLDLLDDLEEAARADGLGQEVDEAKRSIAEM
jgi:hypothetical protein